MHRVSTPCSKTAIRKHVGRVLFRRALHAAIDAARYGLAIHPAAYVHALFHPRCLLLDHRLLLPPFLPNFLLTMLEPKSGTGFMYEWATGALGHACMYLVRAYGQGTCWVEWEFTNRTMVFEPDLAADGTARCPCHDVQRYY